VISIATADPGPEREFRFGASYEFDASESLEGEAIASLPLTDTLGLRVSLRATDMSDGYYENIADPQPTPLFDGATGGTPTQHTAEPAAADQPGQEEVLGRVTLKWTPNDVTTATLKSRRLQLFQQFLVELCRLQVRGRFQPPEPDGALHGRLRHAPEQDSRRHRRVRFPFAQDDGSLYNRYRSWSVSGILNFELDSMTITSVTNWQENSNQWTCACDFQSSAAGTWATETRSGGPSRPSCGHSHRSTGR
jgi:hypothetical protein